MSTTPTSRLGSPLTPRCTRGRPSGEADRDHLAAKLRIADFAITQFFFEVDAYLRLVDDLAARGIDKPVIPGIMPITNIASVAAHGPAERCGHPVVAHRPARRGRPTTLTPSARVGVETRHRTVPRRCSTPARRACTSTPSTAPPRPARSTPTSVWPPEQCPTYGRRTSTGRTWMKAYDKLYIDGAWVAPSRQRHARRHQLHDRRGHGDDPRRRRRPTSTAR